MTEFSEIIANSKFLQAIAILVALGTLILFLYKNVPPALSFIVRWYKDGRIRAFRSLHRPIVRKARFDIIDVRFLLISLFSRSLQVALRLFILIFIVIVTNFLITTLLQLANDRQLETEKPSLVVLLSFLLGIPLGVALAWYVLRPTYQFIFYLYWTRRFVKRDLLSSARARGA